MKTSQIQKNIPKGWELKTMNDICENLDNLRKPVTKSERELGPVPYYGATGIVDYVKDFIFNEKLLLVGEDGADWSKFANSSYIIEGKSWVNNHVHVLRCKKADMYFVKEFLNYNNLGNYITGTTRGKLNKQALMSLKLILPPINEQKQIAEILETVDKEIEKTNEIIEKTEKLKKGLVQKFFIKSKSNVFKLGDICNFTTGKLNSNQAVVGGEYPFFTCSQETFEIDRYSFDQKAVLLAGNNACGNYSVKFYDGKFDAYQRTYVISVKNENNLSYGFLKEFLSSKLNDLKDSSVGTNTKFLTLKLLLDIKINLPKIKEQQKIAEILSAVDEKISVNKKLKEKLIQLKKGLMQDLLSGEVRVNY